MKLLFDLVRGARPSFARDLKRGSWTHVDLDRMLPDDDMPVILADDVASWLRAQDDAEGRDGTAATVLAAQRFEGPLSLAPPPYDRFWVEAWNDYVHPDTGQFIPRAYRVGVVVRTKPDDDELTVETFGWVENRFGLQPPGLGLEYAVERDGHIRAHVNEPGERADGGRPMRWMMKLTPWSKDSLFNQAQKSTREIHVMSMNDDEGAATMAVGVGELVIAASAFMLCRNIRPQRVEVPAAVIKKRGRQLGIDKPAQAYSVINLPGYRTWRTTQRLAAGAGAQVMPSHLVRAHPKRYTADAPLFGKHTGTWLWAPQVRGSHGPTRTPRVTVGLPDEYGTEPTPQEEGHQ